MDMGRLSKVLGVIARYGFDSFIAESSFPGLSRRARQEEHAHRPASVRFRLMLEEMGPIFIKFGQLLSTRPDILPPDFIESLTGLQEEVAPLPWEEIRRELEEHLPAPPEELFRDIEEAPMATASVSQVHRARLSTGEEVVVKVRRPEIDAIVRSDLDLLRGVARVLKGTIVEVSRHDPEKWVDEFAVALDRELDLMNEVRAIQTFAANGSETGQLVVPRVFAELSSSRIIVMEYLEGISVIRVEDRETRKRIARLLIGEAYKQVFVDGYFHADPHPGNVRYLSDGRIGMIDFGLVGSLTPRMRDLVMRLTIAVAFRDAESAAKIVYSTGVASERVDLAALSRDIEELFGMTLGKSLQDIDTERVSVRMMEVISRHGITLPSELALLGKAGVNIEGVVRTLDPEIDVSRAVLPYAQRLVSLPTAPQELIGEALKQFLRLRGWMEQVPLQLDQIMLDVSSGKLNINVSSGQLEGLVPSLRELGALLALGMVAAASIVSAALLIVPYLQDARAFHIPILPVLAVGMTAYAGFLMSLVVGWALLRGRDLRIRLSGWMPILRWSRERRQRKKERARRRAEGR